MSIILAIETSTELASAALLFGDELITEESPGVHTHSETILPMVQRLLARADIPLTRCAAIAFGAGPGSFTGVRTACGVVQGLAFGGELPVAPVVTLEAMAQACREETAGAADNVLAVLDARMGEVYWAQYRFENDQWKMAVEPVLSRAADVRPQGTVQACGNGLVVYAADFAGLPFVTDAFTQLGPHAAQIARLGRSIYLQGKTISSQEAQPIYLRNKVALTTSERRERDLAKGAA